MVPAEILPPLQPRADFTTGANGETRQAWRQMAAPLLGSFGYGGAASGLLGTGGARVSRQGPLAASTVLEMIADPVIAPIFQGKLTAVLGTGLSLSAKIDAAKAGVTPEEARRIATDLEAEWRLWTSNPRECDDLGVSTVHELAAQAFNSWIVSGEHVTLFPSRTLRDAWSRSKVAVLDPTQLDRTYSRSSAIGNAISGVQFSKQGRVVGYWVRTINAGDAYAFPQPKLIPCATTWGRPIILHVLNKRLPGELRGTSPIVASLTPAQERSLLGEYTLAAALIQTSYAATVTSDLPPAAAAAGLRSGGDFVTAGVPMGAAGAAPGMSLAGERLGYYQDNRVELKPSQINFLAPGDAFEFHSAKTPNGTFEAHHNSLVRLAAKSAGLSYEEVSGDYSKTSFSASRLATELPYRIALRERNSVLIPWYAAVYRCFVEEALETGAVRLPRGAKPFYACPEAYLGATWNGPGRVVADPKKAAEADVLEIENGLSTLALKLAERGLDYDEVQSQREREMRDITKRGLKGWTPGPGTVTTQNRNQVEDIIEENAK